MLGVEETDTALRPRGLTKKTVLKLSQQELKTHSVFKTERKSTW